MFSRFGSKKDVNVDYRCTIRLLDDNEVLQFDFQRHHKGYHLLEYVCKALNLIEKDYFGLRYVDASKQRHWLDCTKSIWKQIKGLEPIIFCFRVKFYPPDAYRLKEEITRYQMFLQLRRDLLHGRLYCSQSDSALLAAYIIQSELGDYDHEEHMGNYVAEFKLLLKQTPRLEEKIAEIHQGQLRGQVPAVAEMNFLRKACMLDTYGVDPHPVKDHKGNQLYLGINHAGILTFQGSRKTHHFKWVDIQKINYEGKMFIVHLLFSEKKHLIGFKCSTQAACQHLWRCAVEQRYFFNMTTSEDVPSVTTGGGIFSRASRFRFSGRVEKEIVEDMKQYKRDPPPFQRSLTMTSFRNKPSLEDSMVCPESPNSLKNVDREYEKSDEELPNNSDRFTSLQYSNHNSSIIEEPVVEAEEALIVTTETRETTDFNGEIPEVKSSLIEIKNQTIPTPIPSVIISNSNPNPKPPPNLVPSLIKEETVPRFVEVMEERVLTKSNDIKQVEEKSSTLKEKRVNHVASNLLARPASAPATAPVTRDYNNVSTMRLPNKNSRIAKAGGIRVLLVTSLSLLFILSCLLVFVLESDSPLFSDFRKIPEMILLRREYYEPTKDYIASKVNVLFN